MPQVQYDTDSSSRLDEYEVGVALYEEQADPRTRWDAEETTRFETKITLGRTTLDRLREHFDHGPQALLECLEDAVYSPRSRSYVIFLSPLAREQLCKNLSGALVCCRDERSRESVRRLAA